MTVKQYPYTEFTLEFRSGDLLLLMSDGLPERFNESWEMLGDDSIKRILADYGDTISPQALIEKLLALGDNWAAGIPKTTTSPCSSSKPRSRLQTLVNKRLITPQFPAAQGSSASHGPQC